jgi:hypothetical protein
MDTNLLISVPSGVDKTLCPGGDCPHRFLCFRYLAESSGRQDFFGSPPYTANGICNEFWDARESFRHALKPELIRQKAYELSQSHLNLDTLCWLLAESQTRIDGFYDAKLLPELPFRMAIQFPPLTEQYIRDRAYFHSVACYDSRDILNWLIAEQMLLFQALLQRCEEKELKK